MIKNEIYYAKILLFGEYCVIFNSMGLTIPYTHFTGHLSMPSERKYTNLDFALRSNQDLHEYASYLKNLSSEENEDFNMDFENFDRDLNHGLYFESNIPQGFGLGSSGALVVAIYSAYALNPVIRSRQMEKKDILKLKYIFSRMESFFHGTSSGLDPLNSYMQFPLLINAKDDIQMVNIPRNHNGDSAIFLINTGNPGKTEPLVNSFLESNKNPEYNKKVKEQFIPYNNESIKSLIAGNYDEFFDNLAKLSKFEYEYLKPMIPNAYHKAWDFGNTSSAFHLKLCGSGGGGFLLGFARDYEQAREELGRFNIKPVTVYQKSASKILNNQG